jgi:hypothetical protein
MHRQIQIANAKVVILTSEQLGDVVVNQGLLTATLSGTFTWPSNFVDYYIAFEDDGYEREFLVSTISTNTLTFTDPDSLCPISGTYGFVVRGYPKGETLDLNGLQMWWQFISKTQSAYTTAESGEPSA